jgi:hypothetical protein
MPAADPPIIRRFFPRLYTPCPTPEPRTGRLRWRPPEFEPRPGELDPIDVIVSQDPAPAARLHSLVLDRAAWEEAGRRLAALEASQRAGKGKGGSRVAPGPDRPACVEWCVALVISLNVQRRDLTAGQRAIVAARAMEKFPEQRGGDRSKGKVNGPCILSRETVAKTFKVGVNAVQQARALLAENPDRKENAPAVLITSDRRGTCSRPNLTLLLTFRTVV